MNSKQRIQEERKAFDAHKKRMMQSAPEHAKQSLKLSEDLRAAYMQARKDDSMSTFKIKRSQLLQRMK